ncbi:holo-ACP synthase [Pseudokineococcus basanitobsidens]|uniref:Holo-[acyl-carrier-protein] synthase n=1 Tax=Pseudokineococcus basanitobsidens TaxID=1926649 RepID=A0ABU8RH31_9ACTN
MSVVGVGVDVVDVERFARVLARDGAHGDALRRRLFDDDEAGLPVRSLAARFAAKEALAKALGAPPGLRWRDARVRSGEHGAPHLELAGTVAARAAALGVGAVHLSLSHDGGIATAFVVVEAHGAERAQDGAAGHGEDVADPQPRAEEDL